MSRVYWHTPDQTVELRGSERAWLDQLARGPARAAWGLEHTIDTLERADTIVSLIPESKRGYLQDYRDKALAADAVNRMLINAHVAETDWAPVNRFIDGLRTRLEVESIHLRVAGVDLYSGDLAANTTLAAGSDPIRLALKIHRWCEAHCWVEGPARQWMASVIDDGLDCGLYRRGFWYQNADGTQGPWSDQGWAEVLTLLRSSDADPVVLSYSVEDSFPNPEIARWNVELPPDWAPDWIDEQGWAALPAEDRDCYHRERNAELFWELPPRRRWDEAMAGLRETRPWARLGPDTLRRVYFGPAVTIDDLFVPDRDERIARAVEAYADA